LRLIFLGPPGSGKGTQATKVSAEQHIPQISTGDILRDAVAQKTDLGEKARSYMDSGKLVPDDVMLGLVNERLGHGDCNGGFVLDGFPRTLAQAMGLEEIVKRRDQVIDLVIFIDVDDSVVLERLSRRRVCPRCKTLYNLEANPPKQDGLCDKCGVELVLRVDDAEETVKTRLSVYRNDTLPLVEYYEAKGILRKVKGSGSIEDVFGKVVAAIEEAN
jgi:adenylate kinase